jgi:hypothetical protein
VRRRKEKRNREHTSILPCSWICRLCTKMSVVNRSFQHGTCWMSVFTRNTETKREIVYVGLSIAAKIKTGRISPRSWRRTASARVQVQHCKHNISISSSHDLLSYIQPTITRSGITNVAICYTFVRLIQSPYRKRTIELPTQIPIVNYPKFNPRQ